MIRMWLVTLATVPQTELLSILTLSRGLLATGPYQVTATAATSKMTQMKSHKIPRLNAVKDATASVCAHVGPSLVIFSLVSVGTPCAARSSSIAATAPHASENRSRPPEQAPQGDISWLTSDLPLIRPKPTMPTSRAPSPFRQAVAAI